MITSSSKKATKIHNKSSAYDSDYLINYYFIQLLLITLLKINIIKYLFKKIYIMLQYPSYMDFCFVVILNSCGNIIQNSSFVLHGQNIKWKICLIKWKRIPILAAQKEICSFQYLLYFSISICPWRSSGFKCDSRYTIQDLKFSNFQLQENRTCQYK